VAEGGPSLLSK